MRLIAGVDEVGRGPLAGPVIASAVILKQPIEGVKDSKKLSATQREKLVPLIQKQAIAFAYGRAEVDEIDRLNIHHATLLAMQRAIEALSVKPDEIWVDGLFVPKSLIEAKAIVNGDSLVNAIAAASILAKVWRDNDMLEMSFLYPNYGFEKHKGYSTELHLECLKKWGPCEIHRRSFAPVKVLL